MTHPLEMNAVTIDRFGGAEVLRYGRTLVPQVGPRQVLIKVAYAGVGAWDPFEREGGFVEFTGRTPQFPHTLGGDGSGVVVAVGPQVGGFSEGDLVYGFSGGGFYAEYVALDAATVARVPDGLPLAQAGAMPIVALTALHGLTDELQIDSGDSLLITGASGDVGHLAVQLAKQMGARVLAVASGDDGVQAATELGSEMVIDRNADDLADAIRRFAPDGLDAVLSFAGGATQDTAIAGLRKGGRVAYPLGVEPEPVPRADVASRRYDLTLASAASIRNKLDTLNDMIASGPFTVRIADMYPLDRAAAAQEALAKHRVGKIVLTMSAQQT